MLNIRRGRRREHPKDTSKGSRDIRSLQVLRNFRLRMRNPREPRRRVKWPSITSGSHVTTTKKKAREKSGHAQNLLPIGTASRQGLFRSRDFVTSGQKAILGRIWRNFRLRMRRTYFRTCDSRHFRSCDWCHFRSCHFRSCAMVRSSARSSSNDNWAVPIYYLHDYSPGGAGQKVKYFRTIPLCGNFNNHISRTFLNHSSHWFKSNDVYNGMILYRGQMSISIHKRTN